MAGAGWLAGADLLGQGFNAVMQNVTNIRNRQFTREMYERQREDSLADWNRQNEYNSPAAQMARLKSAGLNPNLVYGTGAATGAAAPIRSSSSSGGSASAPKVDLGSPVGNYLAARNMDAQLNLVAEQEKLVKLRQITEAENAKNKGADTLMKIMNTDKGREALGFITSQRAVMAKINEVTLDNLYARGSQINADVILKMHQQDYTKDKNAREEIALGRSVAESIERVLRSQVARSKDFAEIQHINAKLANLNQDTEIKKFSADLAKEGIDPKSPHWINTIAKFLQEWLPKQSK